ncbi:hypothetical protein EYF80_033494 [Liparis tanakae]|uniref:Uncharacterized protein n=1 Tax=Liparis tanakae TaxID=230148 RepID=A0A4Z2GRJ9_9TELE|nr:hypothetical protein EYF80_033494 [Liparis tanakae]
MAKKYLFPFFFSSPSRNRTTLILGEQRAVEEQPMAAQDREAPRPMGTTSLLAFLPPFSFFSGSAAPSASSWCFLFFLSSGCPGDGCGRRVMIMQVMLSHPVPSPDVSGAKQWSNSCREDTSGLKRRVFRSQLTLQAGPHNDSQPDK